MGDATANDGTDDDSGDVVWKADGDADNDPNTANYKTVKFRVYLLTDTPRSEKVRYTTRVDISVHLRFAQLFNANL